MIAKRRNYYYFLYGAEIRRVGIQTGVSFFLTNFVLMINKEKKALFLHCERRLVWEHGVNERQKSLLMLLFVFFCIGIGSSLGLGVFGSPGDMAICLEWDMDIGIGNWLGSWDWEAED